MSTLPKDVSTAGLPDDTTQELRTVQPSGTSVRLMDDVYPVRSAVSSPLIATPSGTQVTSSGSMLRATVGVPLVGTKSSFACTGAMGTNVNPTITADTAKTPINLTAPRPEPLRPAPKPRIGLLFSLMADFSRLNKKLHHQDKSACGIATSTTSIAPLGASGA
ncbi:unannotated protein [freshwater metagenome]|uniref:Unannotated protein n=1 Tax=freshwater metagenome TaxID=449393 RepID=A0A6J6XS54_9ZZZZ